MTIPVFFIKFKLCDNDIYVFLKFTCEILKRYKYLEKIPTSFPRIIPFCIL